MRQTNRYVSILLAFCLLFCFSACDVDGKDTPVRQSDNTRVIYTQEMYDKFGPPTLASQMGGAKLVADISIESWLRDDDYKETREIGTLYTYYKARVNKVYAGDKSLEGKTIQYAQNGVEEETVFNDSLPGKGDRMLALLTDYNDADNNTYTAVGYNKGVFFILEYRDVAYVVKKYGAFADISGLEVNTDLLRELMIFMCEEKGYPVEKGITTGVDNQCFPQAFVLKELEARIAEIAADHD